MAYSYVNQQIVTNQHNWCMKILNEVQDLLREYFTFDIRLIGSGDKRLVTQNGDEPFDLDYNLFIKRDKQDLIDDPKKIKQLFRNAFKKVLTENLKPYNHVEDSTSVVTVTVFDKSCNVRFKFDVAILVDGDDGYAYKLVKNEQYYIWNRMPYSKDYAEKYLAIKRNNLYPDFKKRYLTLKNMHLSRQDNLKSFSIFLETLNEYRW
mgnify:FL=1